MLGKPSNSFDLDDSSPLTSSAPDTPPAPEPVPASPPRRAKRKPLGWFWLGLMGFTMLGGVSGLAFWWLATPPPSPNCDNISPLSADMERLLCAQEAARSGELPKILAGIELLSQWTPDQPLYREAQRLIAEWSTPVLAAARQRMENSDLRGAVELASRIPKTSPVYPEAHAAIAEWKTVWQKGEAIATAARRAMKAQNWETADLKIAQLREFSQSYWQYDRATALSHLLTTERQGRQLFAQAQTVAKSGQPEQLAAAIAQLSRMDSKTYAWAEAQPTLKQWSETLLALGFQNYLSGNLNQAMTLATGVLPDPNLTQTAQELLWLSQARKHAFGSATTLKPTLPQLWNLSAAISTAQLISPTSRYYSQAQANLKSWMAQFQDLTLLQVAYGLGEVQQIPALQLALWQGTQVTPDRPRRAQAQTLVAYWQQGIRKLEDRPYLLYASKLAEQGTIPALQEAIAAANLIPAKRPLRQEAQTRIADWTRQIQAIADRPILDQAWALANQGQLNAAILAASGVHPGRALYGEAQTAIGGWQAQIDAAELAQQKARQAVPEKLIPPDSQPAQPPLEESPAPENSSEPPAPFPSPSELAPTVQPNAPSVVVPTVPFPAPLNEPPPPPARNSQPLYEPYPPPSRR